MQETKERLFDYCVIAVITYLPAWTALCASSTIHDKWRSKNIYLATWNVVRDTYFTFTRLSDLFSRVTPWCFIGSRVENCTRIETPNIMFIVFLRVGACTIICDIASSQLLKPLYLYPFFSIFTKKLHHFTVNRASSITN